MNTNTIKQLAAKLRDRREITRDIRQSTLDDGATMAPAHDLKRRPQVGVDTASRLLGRITSNFEVGQH